MNIIKLSGKTGIAVFLFLTFLLPFRVKAKNNKLNLIRNISTKSDLYKESITFWGSRPATFSAFKLKNPRRLVIELSHTYIKKCLPGDMKSSVVTSVNCKNMKRGNQRVSQVVFNLDSMVKYRINSNGSKVKLEIYLDRSRVTKSSLIKIKIEKMKTQLNSMRKQLDSAQKKQLEYQRKLKSTLNKFRQKNRKNIKLQNKIKKSRREVAELKNKRIELENNLKSAKNQLKKTRLVERKIKIKIKKLRQKVDKIQDSRKENMKKLAGINQSFQSRQKTKGELLAKIGQDKSRLKKLAKKIRNMKNKNQTIGKQLKNRLKFLKRRLKSSRSKLASTRKELKVFTARRKKLQELCNREEKRFKSLKKNLQEQKTALVKRINKLNKKNNKLARKKNRLEQELLSLKNKREQLGNIVNKKASLSSFIKDKTQKARNLHLKMKQLAKTEQEKVQAARQLKSRLNNLIKKQRKDLNQLESVKGKEVKLLSTLKALRKKHRKLLAQEKLKLQKLKEEGNKVQTRRMKARQLKRIKEIKKLSRKADYWKKLVDKRESELEQVKNKIKTMNTKFSKKRSRYLEIRMEVSQLSRNRDLIRKKIRKSKENLESLNLDAREKTRELAKIKKAIKNKSRIFDRISKKLAKVKKGLGWLSRRKTIKEKELEELNKTATRLKQKVTARKSEIKELKDERSQLLSRFKKLNRKKARLLSQIKNYENKKKSKKQNLQADISKIKQKLQKLKKTRQELIKKVRTIESRKRKIEKVKNSSGYSGKLLALINKVQFKNSPWSHQVILSFKGKQAPGKIFHKDKLFSFKIKGAKFSKKLNRKVDTEAYDGPIKNFLTWNKTQTKEPVAELKINTRGVRKAQIRRRKGKIVVLIPKTVAEVRRYKQQKSKKVAPTRVASYRTALKKTTAKLPAASSRRKRPYLKKRKSKKTSRSGGGKRKYKGRFVDLDFKDADIHNVIRLVAEVWGRNVVIPDEVKGTISIKLNNVRVDRAFDVILKSKGLSWSYEGGKIIRVITMDQMKKEREERLAKTKTKVRMIKTETRLIPINYADAEEISKSITENIKSDRGKVSFDKRTNVIIYTDVPAKLKVARKLINSLDMPTPQVQIEARIVEAESTFLREIGVQWGGSVLANSANGNPTGLIFPSNIGMAGGNMDQLTNASGVDSAGAANPDFAVNLPASTGQGSGGALGMTLGSLAGAVNINLRLSAMEEVGHVRSIATPKITTLDNVEAKISQGVEIPYPQSSAQGNTVIMKQAVLSLAVTPHVTNDNNVKIKVKVTKDEPDETNRGADGSLGIAKKSAETQMLVKSGDTAVIGGIYKRQSTLVYRKVPWFADIPVVGWLFKSKYKRDNRSEILIFITPRVLNRSSVVSKK
ncbi:MAG: type IV pilus secretin PilQ [Myxococcota bacterium]